jgi:hypothetical protein
MLHKEVLGIQVIAKRGNVSYNRIITCIDSSPKGGLLVLLGHKGFGSGVFTYSLLHNKDKKPGNVIDANEDKPCNLIQNPKNPATSYCLTTGNSYRPDWDTSGLKN